MNAERTHRGWRAAVILGALGGLGVVVAAGPLNPPSGPVVPTMKTLEQVEPRIPIGPDTTPGDGNSVYRIAQPGSYYLTENLTGVAGDQGIEIAASNVTIDLMGFTLQGVDGSGDGIRTDGSFTNIVVRNGTVTGWGSDGLDLFGTAFGTSDTSSISSIVASNNGGDGIRALPNSVVRDCTAVDNGAAGIRTASGCLVANCTSNSNDGPGIATNLTCTVQGCLVSFNGDEGVSALEGCLVADNTVRANAIGIKITDDASVLRNSIDSCSTGVQVTGAGSRVESNQLSDCSRGIDVDAAGNFIVRNTVTGGTTKYDIVADNKVGPIVSAPNSGAISGSTGGAGVGTADPWANFSY